MTPNFFEAHKPDGETYNSEMDSLQRVRFELLSAYVDGEVTLAERKQVQEWLTNDPNVKSQYLQLLRVHQGIQLLPVPPADQSIQESIDGVFTRITRTRWKQAFVLGGSAIAALFIGVVSGVLPGGESPLPQLAQSFPLTTAAVAPEPLMVALNAPPVDIPKASLSYPEKTVNAVSEVNFHDHTQNID